MAFFNGYTKISLFARYLPERLLFKVVGSRMRLRASSFIIADYAFALKYAYPNMTIKRVVHFWINKTPKKYQKATDFD